MIKHKRLLRALALLLCLTTLFTSMHLEMLAKESITGATESEVESTNEESTGETTGIEGTFEDATSSEILDGENFAEFASTDDSGEAYILGEVESRRTADSKTFYLSDGSYAVATYNEVIHYEAEDGTFIQVDNRETEKNAKSIEETGQKEYKKRSGNKEISFREKGEKNQKKVKDLDFGNKPEVETETGNHEISMEVEGEIISWSYEGLKDGEIVWDEEEVVEEGNDAFLSLSGVTQRGVYTEAFDSTDLEYIISGEGIKENLILKDKSASNQWVLQMEIGEFEAKQTGEQTIKLYKKGSEEEVFVISAPYMKDANEVINRNITLEMEQRGSHLTIIMTADEEFLQAEERAYPVTVDPYFSLKANENVSISATFITSGEPNHNMQADDGCPCDLVVGFEKSAYDQCRTLLKMNTLPELPAGSVITEALLYMQKYEFGCVGGTSMTVEVAQATVNWNQNTVTWNNYIGRDKGIAVDYYEVTNVTEADYCEITRLVKGWYEGDIPNYGVLLTSKGAEANTNGCCVKYLSPNTESHGIILPTFYITFRCNEGLESYWTYHSQSVNGGTGYVNDYSGNLTFVIPVAETTGLNMPVSVNLVYNASRSNETSQGNVCGYGFMTNYSQRLEAVENIERYSDMAGYLKNYGFDYAWLDGDGTYHFFKLQEDGTYKDEDGLGLTLKVGQTYGTLTGLSIIEDKDGNKYLFSSEGLLLYILNYLTQNIRFTYTGNNLTSITDSAARTIRFTYTADGKISYITAPEGVTRFVYSGNLLRKITYPDQTSVALSYEAADINGTDYYLLTNVVGRDGYELEYSYAVTKNYLRLCRIDTITEYSQSGVEGNRIQYDYENANTTKITYTKESGELTETYQFDDWGQTTGVIGADGSMVNASYSNFNTTNAPAAQLANNHNITQVSSGTTYVNNLLTNHSAENGSEGWTKSGSGLADGTHSRWEEGYLGSYSLCVYQTDSEPKRWSWSQSVSITGGSTYTFSAYVKTENVEVSENGGATLYVTFYDGSTALETIDCDMYLTGDNDWTRIYMTFTAPSDADTVYLYGGLKYVNGTAWFDCFQLEENDTVNPYNVVQNSSFNTNSNWTYSYTKTTGEGISGGTLKMLGDPTSYKNAYQVIDVNKAGVAFFMSAKAIAQSAPNRPTDSDGDGIDEISRFGIAIKYTYADGKSDMFYEYFNSDITEEQNISLCVAPKQANKSKIIDYISVYVVYDKQINAVKFDDIMVTIDETGTSYSYDENGNMISSKDNASRQTVYTIDSATNLVTSIKDSSGTTYSYTYLAANKRKLISAKEDSTGVGFEYTYGTENNAGHITKVRMGIVGAMTDTPYIETSVTYTHNGAYVKAETDQRGNTVTYDVSSVTGQISSVTDASGATVSYTYDDTTKKLTQVSGLGGTVTYSYGEATDGYPLSSIETNSTTYNFTYNEFGNVESINVGDTYHLATYSYGETNGNLEQVVYGNGQVVEYDYDIYDRIIAKRRAWSSSATPSDVATYTYNASGLLARVTDEVNARETNYSYDTSGRMIEYRTTEGIITYGYDNQDRTSEIVTQFGGLTFVSNYHYLNANRPGTSELPIGIIDREYDHLQREKVHKVYANEGDTTHLRSEVTFLGAGGNKTTELIEEYSHYVGTDDTNKELIEGVPTFTYSYDERGNIKKIVETIGDTTYTKVYEYTSGNQLAKEVDEVQGKTIFYTYDGAGNLVKKEIFKGTGSLDDGLVTASTDSTLTQAEEADLTSPLTTISYTYGNEAWGDLLTAYNGTTISYDKAGNPTGYLNGLKFNWSQGRQLSRVYTIRGTVASYQYNTDGIRIGKTVGEVQTDYLLDASGTIQALEQGIQKLVFFYDSTGKREGFSYYIDNDLEGHYYYLYNAQGDVRAILDSEFNAVVLYDYDSWGQPLSTTGELTETLGSLNPFRYRGYVYDEETGLYYLNSRYYDPVVGRFINADSVIADVGGDVRGYNLYAYCFNNPVNMTDASGCWPELFGKVSDIAKSVAEFFEENVGFAVNVGAETMLNRWYGIVATFETGTGYNKCFDNGKAINIYTTVSNEFFDCNDTIGIDINVNGYGGSVQTGQTTSATLHFKESSLEFGYNSLGRTFMKYSYSTNDEYSGYYKLSINWLELAVGVLCLSYAPQAVVAFSYGPALIN